MPKTGSSSIQATLWRENNIEDCEYLKIGKVSNHAPIIFSLFSKRPELYYIHKDEQRTLSQVGEFVRYCRDELTKALTSIQSKQYIISGEDILYLQEDELCELKSYLLQFSCEIFVIGYVRPPISFMQSAAQQNIRAGVVGFGIADFAPNYRNGLEKFDRVFGQDKVLLIKFDPDSLVEGDVVVDFCSRIGISVESKKILRVNESLSLEAIALLYVFHKCCKGGACVPSDKSVKLAQTFSTFGVRKFHYSKSLSDQIRAKIIGDIRWMEDRLGCYFAEPVTGGDDGISSEEDLIKIAFANKDKLSEFISEEMWQQMVTPQGVAELLCRITFSVDKYHEGYFKGWILDYNNPLQRIMIEISQGQRVIARGVANQFRQDLANAGIGDGCCAFVIKVDNDWKNDDQKLFLRAVDFNQQFEINTISIQQCPVKDFKSEHNSFPKVGWIYNVIQNLKDQIERFKGRCLRLSGKVLGDDPRGKRN
jgi:hypothetical protein